MKIIINNIKENPASFLRRAGYIFQRHIGEEMSFIRPLARGGYPRFHIYAYADSGNLIINIHLDQKKETYGDSTRHHGEYEEDGALKKEADRIKTIIG
ncbi:hypothetical protein J7J13_01315 [bacterium]|nr:hypothetical protein [bacterium]